MSKRNTYNTEFKAAAVARMLGTECRFPRPRCYHDPIEDKFQAAGSTDALARQKSDAAELMRLKEENNRLEEENEILQKASAFFAQRVGK